MRVESRNFGRRGRLREAVRSVLATLPPVSVIVAEGPKDLAKLWFEARRGWETELVAAERWRADLLLQRERRSSESAKLRAQQLAKELLESQGYAGRRLLNHDGAEAVLLGLWAVQRRGWRDGTGGRPSSDSDPRVL